MSRLAKMFESLLKVCSACLAFQIVCSEKYKADWRSLDKRSNPEWYDDAKFGIFVNWGVYSVPSYNSEWFWWRWKGDHAGDVVEFMEKNYRPGFTYADFAAEFKTEFFEPDKFAATVKKSGARYIVHSTKHHEGYTLYPSNYSWNWNSVDVGPKRDLIGDLKKAFDKIGGIRYGIYFSQFEWFNPLYLNDKHHMYLKQDYVKMVSQPQLKEIVENYQPEVIWSDGDWEAPDAYWNSTNFLAWLYNESPVKDTVVVNDRWGFGCSCHHGGFYTCQDRFDPGHLISHKWENAMTIDSKSWGYRRDMDLNDVLSIHDIVTKLVRTVSCGGNLLLNVGPSKDGRIVPIFEERIIQIGEWLQINGQAIYGSKPWIFQNDTVNPDVWYTSKLWNSGAVAANRIRNHHKTEEIIVYASVLKWPLNDALYLGAPKPTNKTKIQLLGFPGELIWVGKQGKSGVKIDFSGISFYQLPSTVAWVLKIEYLTEE